MAALVENLRDVIKRDVKPDKAIEERVRRGREAMRRDAALRNECMQFVRGNQFVYRNKENWLAKQGTLQGESGKPNHRIRRARNLLVDVTAREVSAATQRVPSYNCDASTTDPEDISAARLSEKVSLFGFDEWHVRRVTGEVVWYAVVADEGFCWPYFDNTVGTPITEEVSTGEIKIRVFGPNEVGWEPGTRFEESRWHFTEQARPIDAVEQLEGFDGGKLTPDADTSEFLGESAKQPSTKMCLVTEYLERPSQKNPQGRRVIMANKRVICPEEPYPCIDAKGEAVDEPVLHRLSYFVDPDDDRDKGLIRHCLDAQRAYNLASNKQLEWVVLALNPQLVIVNGVLKQRLNDEPGAVYQVMGANSANAIQWRQVPPIPPELSTIRNEATTDIGRIAAQNDIPAQIEAGKAIATFIERDSERRADFIARLAEFHSRLMRHCLYLVQRHYTEKRLLKIRGRFGPELLEDFMGADLRSQVDVRVSPASIEPRTREAIEARIMQFAQLQWITPTAAMAAIAQGTGEKLIEDYELDVAWANHCINLIRGMETMQTTPEQVPEARPFDNHPVQIETLTSWMKTMDYASMGPGPQKAILLLVEQHEYLQAQDEQKAAAAQAQQAAAMGMDNASKPQDKPLPSLPQPNSQQPPSQGPPNG